MTDQTTPAGPARRASLSARVARIVDRAPDTRSLFLSPAARLRFAPGQFISVAIPLGDETRTRPYTIASSPEDGGAFEIVFNRVAGGRGVDWLFERGVGDSIEFTGPFGLFSLERSPAAETVFIAEHTAIAPIRPMVRRAAAAPGHPRLTLLYAAADRAHLLYREEFEELERRDRAFSFETMVCAPAQRLYERLLEIANARWVEGDADRGGQFYICGVGAGVLRLRDLLRGAGYERRAVRYEQW